MKPVSLADISYEQALQLLVLRKQALDAGVIRRMPKEAMDNAPLCQVGSDVLEKLAEGGLLDSVSSGLSGIANQAQSAFDRSGLRDMGNNAASGVQNWWKGMNPHARDTLKKGLIGTGVGAGTGLTASLMNGEGHYGRNMLMGGIAGGAIGGGLGIFQNPEVADLIRDRVQELTPSPSSTPNKPKAAPGADTPGAPDAGAPGAAPWNAATEADKIMGIEDDLLREDAVNALRGDVETSANNVGSAIGYGASVGLPAYGARKLHNMEQYTPEALRDTLRMQKTPNVDGIKGMFGETMTPSALRQMPEEELLELIRKHPKLQQTWLGNAENPNAIKQLLGLPQDTKGIPGATSARFSKVRPGRTMGLMGLLGLGGAGIVNTYKNHQRNLAEQAKAQMVLDNLLAASRRKSGG
jgi:hypothetical protein